jgi:hypothetical protein
MGDSALSTGLIDFAFGPGQFGHAQQRINWGDPFQPGELAFTVALAVLPDQRLVVSDLNGAFSQLLVVPASG